MKKLVAARPIQYMGRTYESGDTVPAYDNKMVEAWLSAGSASWVGAEDSVVNAIAAPEMQAAAALKSMGVSIWDDDGNFVGAEDLEEQIRNIVFASTEGTQDDMQDDQKTGIPCEHPDAEKLEKAMTRDQLDKLATDMGLNISDCKNKGDVAKLIANQPVQASEEENGGAQ